MISIHGRGPPPKDPGNPEGINRLRRRYFVRNEKGEQVEITSFKEFDIILSRMTPEQQEQFKSNYRFCPITNLTRNPNYFGTLSDI